MNGKRVICFSQNFLYYYHFIYAQVSQPMSSFEVFPTQFIVSNTEAD
jgi:hypothetical protein